MAIRFEPLRVIGFGFDPQHGEGGGEEGQRDGEGGFGLSHTNTERRHIPQRPTPQQYCHTSTSRGAGDGRGGHGTPASSLSIDVTHSTLEDEPRVTTLEAAL